MHGPARLSLRDDRRQQPKNACAGLSNRRWTQIVGRQIDGGGERQSGLKAGEGFSDAAAQLHEVSTRQNAWLIEEACPIALLRAPEQRCNLLHTRFLGERGGVTSAIGQPAVVDECDT